MFKVRNKFIFIALVGLALGLLFWPILAMLLFTTFAWWQMLVVIGTIVLPALIGLSILFNVWGTFEIKGEAQEH